MTENSPPVGAATGPTTFEPHRQEALFQDRHPFQPAFPFTDQHCSRSQIDTLPRGGDASFKQTAFRRVGSLAFRLTNDAQRRFVETAERGGLDLIRQDPEQQPTRQMGGRGPAQVVAPLQAKPICVEISEARDQIAEGRCLVRSRRRRRGTSPAPPECRCIGITPLDALWILRQGDY